ncbi:unnamed protein product [Leuciscus chuanchicus]
MSKTRTLWSSYRPVVFRKPKALKINKTWMVGWGSAALLSLQHHSGSESEDPLGQIFRYNDRSLYEHLTFAILSIRSGLDLFSPQSSTALLQPPSTASDSTDLQLMYGT